MHLHVATGSGLHGLIYCRQMCPVTFINKVSVTNEESDKVSCEAAGNCRYLSTLHCELGQKCLISYLLCIKSLLPSSNYKTGAIPCVSSVFVSSLLSHSSQHYDSLFDQNLHSNFNNLLFIRLVLRFTHEAIST